MKLTRFRKQIIAIVCSIALVIAGFAFAPAFAGWTAPGTRARVQPKGRRTAAPSLRVAALGVIRWGSTMGLHPEHGQHARSRHSVILETLAPTGLSLRPLGPVNFDIGSPPWFAGQSLHLALIGRLE